MNTLKTTNKGKLEFCYNNILLSFFLEKNGRMSLLYVGRKKEIKGISKFKRSYRTFVEIDMVEDDRNSHHGNKHIESAYSKTYKYISHRSLKNEKGDLLIIVTRNEFLEVETHFQFYDEVEGFSSFNVVKNISKAPITLLNVSSFVNIGFTKANFKQYELYQADSSWNSEAQWKKDNLLHLGIYNGNNYFSNKRYNISNVGAWSTKDHLPMMVINNKRTKDSILVQIENNGSWNLELGDINDYLYYYASGPEFIDHDWRKILKPNEEFVSCQATLTFGKGFEKVIQEITKIRRKYRRISKDNEELPVIFNDYMHALWDTQTTELILPLVDIASEVDCKIFCMDAGWFEEGSQWWDILGVWKEHEPNFPNGGLKAVCDYIRKKNMRAGLWLEPEAVGINSIMAKKLPDDYFFHFNGKRTVTNKRYTLNFANPKAYQYMLNVVKDLINKYGLKYLKFDYNTEVGKGNDLNSDSLGDGLLNHNRAYIRWLNEIMDNFPDVTIENCASGGCRMDNEILKYCPIQSTSDQTNFKKYPYLSANVLTATTPEQAAVWSYPVNAYIKNYMPDDEAVAMNMCNAMLGRIHLASYINKLPANQIDLIKEGIRFFNSITKMKQHSLPIYPKGTARFFDKEVVGGIEDDKQIILGVWNTSNKKRTIKVDLSKYHVKKINVGYPTSLPTKYSFDSTTSILEVEFDSKYGGRIFVINKVLFKKDIKS